MVPKQLVSKRLVGKEKKTLQQSSEPIQRQWIWVLWPSLLIPSCLAFFSTTPESVGNYGDRAINYCYRGTKKKPAKDYAKRQPQCPRGN